MSAEEFARMETVQPMAAPAQADDREEAMRRIAELERKVGMLTDLLEEILDRQSRERIARIRG